MDNSQTSRIGDYILRREIGKGSFGIVYKAQHINEKSNVALKLIKRTVLHRDMESCIENEISIHKKLEHDHILKLYNTFEVNNYICFVTKLCETDLCKLLNESPAYFDIPNVKIMMVQIVEGLIYLQKNGVIHRDLKLSNLLIDYESKIKIADFGMAIRQLPNVKHRTVCGTLSYMAPEVLQNRDQGFKVDVWSLGCVFYAMLVGKGPFERPSENETRHSVINGKYKVPDDVIPQARRLIELMLQVDPTKRIQVTDITKTDFFEDLNGGVIEVPFRLNQKMNHRHPSSRMQGMALQHYDARSHRSQPEIQQNSFNNSRHRHHLSNIDMSKPPPMHSNRPLGVGSHCMGNSYQSSNPSKSRKPFTSFRLKYIRKKLRNGTVTIMPRETQWGRIVEVFLEVTNINDHVEKAYVISEDGNEIEVCILKPPVLISDEPVDVRKHHTESYNLDDLTPDDFKRYLYVKRFIDVIKSVTPKLTFHCGRGNDKFMIMENGIEVSKTQNGFKITSGAKEYTVNKVEKTYVLVGTRDQLPKCFYDVLDHASEGFEFLKDLERVCKKWDKNYFSTFPIFSGMRPLTKQDHSSQTKSQTPLRQQDSGFESSLRSNSLMTRSLGNNANGSQFSSGQMGRHNTYQHAPPSYMNENAAHNLHRTHH